MPSLRGPFVFIFSRSFGVVDGLMPGIGVRVPIRIAEEQVIAPFAGIPGNGEASGGTNLFPPDEVLGLVCTVDS